MDKDYRFIEIRGHKRNGEPLWHVGAYSREYPDEGCDIVADLWGWAAEQPVGLKGEDSG